MHRDVTSIFAYYLKRNFSRNKQNFTYRYIHIRRAKIILFSKSHFGCVIIKLTLQISFNLHVSKDEYLENKKIDRETEGFLMVYIFKYIIDRDQK